MLTSLLSAVPKGNKRHPIVFYRLLDTLSDRLALAKNKFVLSNLPRTDGVEVLRWMLLNFDLKQASSYLDDTTLFTEFLEPHQDKYRNVIDPVWMKTLDRSKYIRNRDKVKTTEIILNCSSESPIDLYPFGKDWTEWKMTRAFKLLYHPSNDLPIDMFTGYITFKEDRYPKFAVFSLNIPVLLMKWVKYNQWCEQNKTTPDELDFLKESEFAQFFYDLQDIWVTNVLLTTLEHPQMTAEEIAEAVSLPKYITSEGIVQQAVTDLKTQVELIASRNLKVSDFIDTEWYPETNNSIRQRISWIKKTTVLPEMRQYLWMDILKVLPYLKMVVGAINLDPDNPLNLPLIRKAYNLYVKYIKFANLPNFQYSDPIKQYIGMACKEFEQIFDGKIDAPTEVNA